MRITSSCIALLAASTALSACSAAQPEAVAPKAAAVAAVAEQPAPSAPAPVEPARGDWTDWPLAAGDWVYREDARGSLALFGPTGNDAVFMIRCDQMRSQLFLSRAGQTIASGAQMTLRGSSGLKSYPAQNTGGSQSYAAIAVDPADFMMDRIIFSRGRFAVETTGLQPLAIPTWPEFHRVVEDCRK